MTGRQQKIRRFQTFAFLLLPFALPSDIKYRMGRDSGGDD